MTLQILLSYLYDFSSVPQMALAVSKYNLTMMHINMYNNSRHLCDLQTFIHYTQHYMFRPQRAIIRYIYKICYIVVMLLIYYRYYIVA
jgi:hypothetical protein